MKQDEIIEMAMKSGCPKVNAFANFDILQEFAKLVAAKERESCIELIKSHGPTLANGFMLTEAIRARGEA